VKDILLTITITLGLAGGIIFLVLFTSLIVWVILA
jgi:hypothetical protein